MRMASTFILPALGTLLLAGPLRSAEERPAPPEKTVSQRILEDRVKFLEKRVAELEKGGKGASKKDLEKAIKKEVEKRFGDELDKEIEKKMEKNYSKGIVTLGGLSFRLGGQMKINLVDEQNEEGSTIFGNTENPDPHLEIQRFRLSPQVNFPKSDVLGDFTLRGQFDFYPTEGDTVLREATLDHELAPTWWFESILTLGLDDRFVTGERVTQTRPLVGTSYWRNESVAIFWEGTLGDKRGMPEKKSKKAKRSPMDRDLRQEFGSNITEPAFDGAPGEKESVPSRSSMTKSTIYEPLDFSSNPGALKVHLSIGNGYELGSRKIGRDNASFNQILADERTFDAPLTMRELGAGVGYARDFREMGELELLAFYYNDELSSSSVNFLQNNLTLRDPITQAPIAGYGDSDSRDKDRMGFNVGYHLEAYHLYRALGVEQVLNPRGGDGLNLFYQWLGSTDGELDRRSWYAQASYRFSNPARWRFLRTIEPLVRYGELNPKMERIPSLPLSWWRSQWTLGMILGLAPGLYVRTEYNINNESTGSGSVSNNEFLIQFLAMF